MQVSLLSLNFDHQLQVVGNFLSKVFNGHSLPQRSQRVRCLDLSAESHQILHSCIGYKQQQLIQLIVKIYNGVPESFEVFHCQSTSTEEEVSLFLKRAARHQLTCLMLEVNRLPYKLQEVCFKCILHYHSLGLPYHIVETLGNR